MGYGFQKKKKTAKVLEADTANLKDAFLQNFSRLANKVGELGAQLKTIGTQATTADLRGLATLRVLVEKGILTLEENDRMAETIRIEMFNEQDAADSLRNGLQLTDAGIGPDTIFTFRLDAEYPLDSDRVGESIPELSMLRSKMEFGEHHDIFPANFEEQLLGAKAGETRIFTMPCPKTFGAWADKPVTFKAQIFSVLTPPPVPEEAVPAGVGSNVVSLNQPN